MKKRILSIITALALTMALLPAAAVPARAAGAGRTVQVSNSDTFNSAIAALQDGDTIQLTNSFEVTTPTSSNDSLFIGKNVTIDGQGHSLSLRYAGVLLGADVTFKNVSLGLSSNVRPALMANGHTLTLEDVQRNPTCRNINLFCGGLTGGNQGGLSQGGHGQIIIKGNTYLGPTGRIFAGSISADGKNNEFAKPATVTIDPSVKGDAIGELYACGALETYTSEEDWFDYQNEIKPPFASPGNFKVRGKVIFNLYQSKVGKVSGDTGAGGNLAQVNYNGTDFLNDNLVLSSIGGLTVNGGNLAPTAGRLEQNNVNTADRTSEIVSVSGGSCFNSTNAPLKVDAGATLGLQNLGNVTVGDFTGGSLVLGADQRLTVTGTVSGTTTVGIGGIFNGHSQTVPDTNGHIYIDAASSTENSFAFAAPAGRPDIELVYQTGGIWKAEEGHRSTDSIVDDFALTSVVFDPNNEEGNASWFATLPFAYVRYAPNSAENPIAFIPLTIKVNEVNTTRTDENGSFSYKTSDLELAIAGDPKSEEVQISTISPNESQEVPLTGSYIIEVTVPASNSGTGQPITRTATLTVKTAGNQDTSIPVPVANTGLVYNGQEQIGVPLNDAYQLSSGSVATATNAGEYKTKVTPATDFTWDGGGTEEKTISWSIAKADNPNPLPSLSVAAPTAYGNLDGKITGTTAGMEYADNDGFSGAGNCGQGETTGLAAGDYYVRYKADTNHFAGTSVMVTVPQGPITVKKIAIATPATKTEYKTGEALDVTGLALSVTMSDGKTYTVPVAAGMVSGFDSSVTGSQPLTINYGGKTASYTISIVESASGGDSGNTGGGSGGSGGSSGGGGGGGGGSSAGDSSSSNTTTNPDGSVTTTVTDEKTGTVTTTTKKPDGTTTVIEAKKDGTVTITDTAKNGVKVEAVSKPETDTSARITLPTGVKTATVTVPVTVTPGMVAVDAKTGEIVKLSAPTEDGMVVKLDGSADLILEDRSKAFEDTDGHWAKSAIDFTTARALFSGTSSTTFAPNQPMTRGMVAVVLHNFEGNPDSAAGTSFTDVASDKWYTDAVSWVTDKGIAGGYGDGSFGTDDHVTREQLITFLYRYADVMGYSTEGGADLSAFPDGASVSGYAAEAMSWAVGNGLIVGTDGGALAPGGSATRAQVASILNRFVLNLMK